MAQVPSNLIPTTITQLQVAPVADENSLMMIVYEGNNYKIRVGDLLSVAGVPTSRQVIAGTGLSGGGQLLNNVTLSIAPSGVTSSLIAPTGVTSGVYGGSTAIPQVTVNAQGQITAISNVPFTIAGYVPETRQVIAGSGLTGGGPLNANVTLSASLSNTASLSSFQSGSAGTSTNVVRADHRHPAVDLSDDTNQVDGLLGLANGGTARSLTMNPGAVIWSGSDGMYVSPAGVFGQVLVSGGADSPTWGSAVIIAPVPASRFYSGPVSGGSADPTFRAIVATDIPTLNQNTTGNAATATNVPYTGLTGTIPTWNQNTTGNAATATNASTVTTNANLTGAVTSVGNATSLGSFTSAQLATALTDETGTGANVFATSPTLVTPALGTPTSLIGTNITGAAAGLSIGGNAATATNVPYSGLTGTVPTWNQNTTGNAATATNVPYSGLTGTVPTWNQNTTGNAATATNASTVTTNANFTGAVTSVGNAASLGSFTSAQLATALTDETGTGANVFATSPTLVTPALGTPSALVGTNITGTAAGLSIGGNAATATNVPYTGLTGTIPTWNQNTTGNAATATNVPYTGLTGTIPTWNQNTTGNAATATNVPYTGLTGTVPTWNQNTTGNAATATNVNYSGLTGTIPTWNQNTTGNAATATNTTITANSTNAINYLTFVSNTLGNLPQLIQSGITVNPSTSAITGGIRGGAF